MLRSGSRTRRRFLSLMEAMQKGWLGRMGSEWWWFENNPIVMI
jgi:D-alanyl-D-alanine dipeptidase